MPQRLLNPGEHGQMASGKLIYQELHPVTRSQLGQRYIDYFDQILQYLRPIEQSGEWHRSYVGTASDTVEVETRDIQRSTHRVRVRKSPERKLCPGFVYFHGGKAVEPLSLERSSKVKL